MDTADGEIRPAVADAEASAEAVRRLDIHRVPVAALESRDPCLARGLLLVFVPLSVRAFRRA